MSAFAAFLGKELLEIRRTWRLYVLPGLILFFALTSPILAIITPGLVRSLAGGQPGVVIELPDPVALDAYVQFLKNLNQIVLCALIIACAGSVSGERRAGTAILVLTKPLSRGAFVLAKIASQMTLLGIATLVGACLCVVMTALLFGSSPIESFLLAVCVWFLHAALFVVLMTLLSVYSISVGAAAGIGLGIYFLFFLFAQIEACARHTFLGLPAAAGQLLDGGDPPLLLPVLTGVLSACLLATLATRRFNRTEL